MHVTMSFAIKDFIVFGNSQRAPYNCYVILIKQLTVLLNAVDKPLTLLSYSIYYYPNIYQRKQIISFYLNGSKYRVRI